MAEEAGEALLRKVRELAEKHNGAMIEVEAQLVPAGAGGDVQFSTVDTGNGFAAVTSGLSLVEADKIVRSIHGENAHEKMMQMVTNIGLTKEEATRTFRVIEDFQRQEPAVESLELEMDDSACDNCKFRFRTVMNGRNAVFKMMERIQCCSRHQGQGKEDDSDVEETCSCEWEHSIDDENMIMSRRTHRCQDCVDQPEVYHQNPLEFVRMFRTSITHPHAKATDTRLLNIMTRAIDSKFDRITRLHSSAQNAMETCKRELPELIAGEMRTWNTNIRTELRKVMDILINVEMQKSDERTESLVDLRLDSLREEISKISSARTPINNLKKKISQLEKKVNQMTTLSTAQREQAQQMATLATAQREQAQQMAIIIGKQQESEQQDTMMRALQEQRQMIEQLQRTVAEQAQVIEQLQNPFAVRPRNDIILGSYDGPSLLAELGDNPVYDPDGTA